ncbi:MAG: hypothetical protein J7621_10935 [Niastella sp.]|nr:hypothetical protein [Niastella sp.]
MKLLLIRYTKIWFTYLQLHYVFNAFNAFLLNLMHMSKLSEWISKNKPLYNDFPSKWDYNKRFDFYEWVLMQEKLVDSPVNYLEFGVANGHSMRWFSEKNHHADSEFHGFDTFTGLPEDWGPYKKGTFGTGNQVPVIDDTRIQFHQGLFQQTLPGFVKQFPENKRSILFMDADLYSATLYTLTSLALFLKKGDIIFFDQFAVPTHEFRAYTDFIESFYLDLELIGASNNYYFVAFKVV